MRAAIPSDIEISYFDADGGDLTQFGWTPEYFADLQQTANVDLTRENEARVALLSDHEVAKPDWFTAGEHSARRFVQGLGLAAAEGTQVTLVNVPAAVTQRVFPDEKTTDSVDTEYSPAYGLVYRIDRARNAFAKGGHIAIGRVVTAGLVKASEPVGNILARFDKVSNSWTNAWRTGFQMQIGDKIIGQFYTAGLAEFLAGYYQRSETQPDCQIVSIKDDPPLELPGHYTDLRPDRFEPYVNGPDGYAIELLAWCAEHLGIISAERFIRSMLLAYDVNPTLRPAGVGAFNSRMNAIDPRLNRRLLALTKGREQWQRGLEITYEAVTW